MASINNLRVNDDGKCVATVDLDEKEVLQLRGHTNGIVLFCPDEGICDARISQRGRNGGTKYFLVPRELREGVKLNSSVKCCKVEIDGVVYFIYCVDLLSVRS